MKKLLLMTFLIPVLGFSQTPEDQINAVANEQARILYMQQEQARQQQLAKERELAIQRARQASIDAEKAKLRHADNEAYIAKKKAEAKLAEESVKADIDRKKAVTDVIQSDADARRNVSEGERDLRKGIGEGAKKVSWWDFLTK